MSTADQARPLSAATIVEAALELADADGLQAVTMRAVGARLGAAAMSLYRHVPNKDALLEQMADHVLAKLPYPDPEQPWQGEIHAFFLAFHDLLLEHPAVAQVMVEMALAGPELSLRGEQVLACLLGGGLDEPTAAQAITALTWHTVGGSLYAIARRNPQHEDRTIRLDALPAAQFPAVHRVAPYLADDASRSHFEGALWHLIRGYEPR
ncbi:MAG TPA: TetR family transcriptional regulator [Solirubrobacteraceae bacterium]|jgi:AcrR family transcriptional regulator|nr:TetR family transcriptional regulator [Solirubrobacteraceae bacterium]